MPANKNLNLENIKSNRGSRGRHLIPSLILLRMCIVGSNFMVGGGPI